MKKIIALLIATLMFTALFSTFAVSAASTDVVTEWFCWEKDGTELQVGKVKTSDKGIVKQLSKNYYVAAQGAQNKITDTYLSPATVWTNEKTTNENLELVWEVTGNTFVEIGFLHCIGKTDPKDVDVVCLADGSDLPTKCNIKWSADGSKWNDIDFDVLPADHALVSGMTGYTAEQIKPFNGNPEKGNDADVYSEKYFVISGTVGAEAKYVKYTYLPAQRLNYWDPCVRDARFTSPKTGDTSQTPSKEEPSKPVVPVDVNVLLDNKYTTVLGEGGNVRTGGYGDYADDGKTCLYKLTDGLKSAEDGGTGTGAYDSKNVDFIFDLGAKKDNLYLFSMDLFANASWAIVDPISVEYFVSDDGKTYTSAGKVELAAAKKSGADNWVKYLFELKLDKPVSAKFIKVAAVTGSHVWSTEITAMQKAADKPVSPDTSDNGFVALAVVASLAVAGAVIVKKYR